MNSDTLRALQAPLKQRYRDDPSAAVVTLRATGALGEGIACRVDTGRAVVEAGLHPATGGTGLAACAGVTLRAVATALGVPLRGGRVSAEGDLDFRGTLGVEREARVGFSSIRLRFELDTDATEELLDVLLKLTERYCVVLQTLRTPPEVTLSRDYSAPPS